MDADQRVLQDLNDVIARREAEMCGEACDPNLVNVEVND